MRLAWVTSQEGKPYRSTAGSLSGEGRRRLMVPATGLLPHTEDVAALDVNRMKNLDLHEGGDNLIIDDKLFSVFSATSSSFADTDAVQEDDESSTFSPLVKSIQASRLHSSRTNGDIRVDLDRRLRWDSSTGLETRAEPMLSSFRIRTKSLDHEWYA